MKPKLVKWQANLFFYCLSLLLLSYGAPGQTTRFEEEIRAFTSQDRQEGYQKDFILFTGSSSIRLWRSLEEDMKGWKVLNRGFGGATLRELNSYWESIAGKHRPDLVVLYCGENDLFEGASVDETVQNFETFLLQFRSSYPTVPLIYIAMKPSLSRWHLWEKFQEADLLIKQRLQADPNVTYVDLSPTMFDGRTLNTTIFESDSLHMNAQGYQGWTRTLRPIIDRIISN